MFPIPATEIRELANVIRLQSGRALSAIGSAGKPPHG